jgi:2-polyprenyl-3-methyl-5-hydroxy-6-metoxy-1,4-benzoquinol methylase
MKEQKLYDKYLDGRHRENHPTIYAERFIDFLKKNIFDALIVDIGCGDGRDVNAFSKEGFNVL